MKQFRHPILFIAIGLLTGLVFSASITYAALTFSSSSVVSDGNLSLTASGTVDAGTGTFSFGTASGTKIQTGNVTTTNLTVSGLGSSGTPCLSVSATGVVATTTCGSGGGGQATSAAFALGAVSAPSPAATSTCPTGVNPFMWIQDASGTYQTQAGIASTTDITNGPPGPGGTMVFCRRTWFNDTGAAQIGKNAFISINHTEAVGTVQTNQDRTLWVSIANPANDTSTMYAMTSIQAETDINGTPSFSGHPDGEISVGSFQVADNHTTTLSGPQLGITGIRAQYYREAGAGAWSSCGACGVGIYAIASNLSAGDAGSTGIVAGQFYADNSGLIANNLNGTAVKIIPPTYRFTHSYGLYVGDYGTNTSDFAIKSLGGQNAFSGPLVLVEEPSSTAQKFDAAGQTVLWADSTTHAPTFVAASGTALQVVGAASALASTPTLVCTDSNGNLTTSGCPTASTGAGGTSTQVQINSGGSLAGAADFLYTVSSTLTQLTVPTGTASGPGLVFGNTTSTGFYMPSAGVLGFMSQRSASQSAPELRLYRWTGSAYTLNFGFGAGASGGTTLQSYEASAGAILIAGVAATNAGTDITLGGNGGNGGHDFSATAGTQVAVSVGAASNAGRIIFNPASGNANFIGFQVIPTINQTSTASGNYTALKIGVTETSLKGSSNKLIDAFVGASASTEVFNVDNLGNVQAASYRTNANCASSGGTCGAASAGMVSIAAATTTVTVNTTAVTSSSEILVSFDETLGTALGVTCNAAGASEAAQYFVSARSAGTSFTIKTSVAPTTDPACLSYTIIN